VRTTYRLAAISVLMLVLAAGCSARTHLEAPDGSSIVRMIYFYKPDCPHCQTVQNEVLGPLQADYGERLEIRWIEIDDPNSYELLVRTEEYFDLAPEERGLPTLVVGGHILIGEEQIRRDLPCLLESCLSSGTTWPQIPGLEELAEATPAVPPLVGPELEPGVGGVGVCEEGEAVVCSEPATVWAAYFYQVGCQKCSRAEADIRYVRSRYPQLVVEEFNGYDDLDVAAWLMERIGRDWEEFHTPAIFIGDDALIGEEEITPQNLEGLVAKYAPTGVAKTWEETGPSSFALPPLLTVVLAGLVDGLNPCAFATLVFFVAYLSASGRQGREVLLVGGTFALGVFGAYVAVGLGLYRVLDLLRGLLTALGRWVYGLTALFCAVLAVYSLLDFVKARRGQIGDMRLSLPGYLRARINAVIRRSQRVEAYALAAFVTGILISLLELACTGQVYLPTIIFIISVPELRGQAVSYLLLYNLLFILPLVVVFVLTYYGTNSVQLGLFLKRHTATVKLVTALLFAALAVWLGLSLL